MAITITRTIEAPRPRPVPGLYLYGNAVVIVTPIRQPIWSAPMPPNVQHQVTYLEGDDVGRTANITDGEFQSLELFDGAVTLQNEVEL